MTKLVVCILGNQNSGKTYTWNTLFGKTVRTGKNQHDLSMGDSKYVKVFLVSASAEERKMYVGKIIKGNPRIVLCSMQYKDEVKHTIDYFVDNGYSLFVHWLNPGHSDSGKRTDVLGLVPYLLDRGALVGVRDGKVDAHAHARVDEMRNFIYGWADAQGLIKC